MKLGIIGGSGLDDPQFLQDYQEIEVETQYGKPSSSLIIGKISGMDVVILARHGKKHEIPPSKVNYRANIQALKDQGCMHIISTTAVGSLKEEIRRGDFVILDQFIDFTRHREITFFESFEGEPKHTPMAEPFSEFLREKIIQSAQQLGLSYHPKGTVITIEGPRFSTRAESNMFRQFADVINMSIAPEAILANEAGIEYATIAMSTDYDCWKTDEPPVSWDAILEIFNKNAENVKTLILKTIENIAQESLVKNDKNFIKSKIRTIPHWPKQGIMFRDITTLLKDPQGFEKVINIFTERYKDKQIDVIAGIESRGFIIAGALAHKLGISFVPIRKKGKLPAETESQEYALEYGTDCVEIHKDAIKSGDKVLLIDDLLATGGTALASCQLIEKLGGEIAECGFIIELPELKGKEKLANYEIFNIVEFREDEM